MTNAPATGHEPVVIDLNAVIVAVTREQPRILVVRRPDAGAPDGEALPFGPLDPERDRTLELGLRGWVREQTGLELGYVEQLYTFGDRARRGPTGPRIISIAYLGLVLESERSTEYAGWQDIYRFFPWEDWRHGRPAVLDTAIVPAIRTWVRQVEDAARRQRRERTDIAFGLGGASWDGERVLDRYELLYEIGLTDEAHRDHGEALSGEQPSDERPDRALGHPLALDHRRILATALGRLRGKIKYRPVVFELLPPEFTLLQLQRVVEALSGVELHKQNFRRLVERGGLVEGTGRLDTHTGGRPAELFSFRRDVLRERPAPGVGLPART